MHLTGAKQGLSFIECWNSKIFKGQRKSKSLFLTHTFVSQPIVLFIGENSKTKNEIDEMRVKGLFFCWIFWKNFFVLKIYDAILELVIWVFEILSSFIGVYKIYQCEVTFWPKKLKKLREFRILKLITKIWVWNRILGFTNS